MSARFIPTGTRSAPTISVLKIFRLPGCLGVYPRPSCTSPSSIYKANLLSRRVSCPSNDHCAAPFSEPLGWLVPPKFTRTGRRMVMESMSFIAHPGSRTLVKQLPWQTACIRHMSKVPRQNIRCDAKGGGQSSGGPTRGFTVNGERRGRVCATPFE